MSKKKRLAIVTVFIAAIIIAVALTIWFWPKRSAGIIKVGVLHSLTGVMAVSERPLIEAAQFAIDDINAKGGLLGKTVVAVVADGKSDWNIFAQEAERLITQEGVVAIFGCWTSGSRKHVKEVVEKYNKLLFYPSHFEGLETSPNIVYMGASFNQQTIPAVIWSLDNLGKRLFLIGTDSVFSHVTNAIVQELVAARKGEIVGERYASINERDFSAIVEEIQNKQPKVIINSLNGEANLHFSQALRKAGISSEKIPTMALSITETELQMFNIDHMIGDYGTQSYFGSLDTPANREFVSHFRKRIGNDIAISNNMENVYSSFRFWKWAAIKANSTDTDAVRAMLSERALSTPEGVISIDKETQYTWKPVVIGKIFANKQFGIVWNSVSTIGPLVYPPFKSNEFWDQLSESIYQKYGQQWQ